MTLTAVQANPIDDGRAGSLVVVDDSNDVIGARLSISCIVIDGPGLVVSAENVAGIAGTSLISIGDVIGVQVDLLGPFRSWMPMAQLLTTGDAPVPDLLVGVRVLSNDVGSWWFFVMAKDGSVHDISEIASKGTIQIVFVPSASGEIERIT